MAPLAPTTTPGCLPAPVRPTQPLQTQGHPFPCRFGAGQMLCQKQPRFISPVAVESFQAGQGAPAASHGRGAGAAQGCPCNRKARAAQLSDPRGYF